MTAYQIHSQAAAAIGLLIFSVLRRWEHSAVWVVVWGWLFSPH